METRNCSQCRALCYPDSMISSRCVTCTRKYVKELKQRIAELEQRIAELEKAKLETVAQPDSTTIVQ